MCLNSDYSSVLLNVAVCLNAQISQEGKWHSRWLLHTSQETEFLQKCHRNSFQRKCPYHRERLHTSGIASYPILVHAHCGAIRTIICKDLATPYSSSKGYKYDNYLHWQMKEWAWSHASKRASNDRCGNRIRSCWETVSLLGEKSLAGFFTWVQIMALRKNSLIIEIIVNSFWESLVKPPETQENLLVRR